MSRANPVLVSERPRRSASSARHSLSVEELSDMKAFARHLLTIGPLASLVATALLIAGAQVAR